MATELLRCISSFAYTADAKSGEQRVVREGDLLKASDKAIKGREVFFEPVIADVERAERRRSGQVDMGVEQATRAPGERRNVRGVSKPAKEAPAAAEWSKDD